MSAVKGKRLLAASEKAKENEILNVSKLMIAYIQNAMPAQLRLPFTKYNRYH